MRILSARVICVLVLIASLLIPTPTAAQQALKRVRMGIAYFGGNLIGIWVAKERGFFRTHGLDVQFVQLSGDTLASQALLGGNIDINAGSTIGALAVAAAGGDIIDFAILGPVLPYVFVVRPGIATAQDLRGRRLGLSGPGLSLSRFGVVLALRHLGLDVRKDNIVLQPLGSTPVRLAAMASGALDGTVLNVEEQQMAADRGLKVMVDVTTLGVPVEANALFASRQYAEQNPAVMAGS